MSYSVKDIRNVCLLGHSGSGKTALAESMLYMTKTIDRMGRAADGNTVCDSDPEEVKRQISLSTAVAPIDYQGCRINVLDAPGAFDFAGEVMEALSAADAAIIVCAAKDGVSGVRQHRFERHAVPDTLQALDFLAEVKVTALCHAAQKVPETLVVRLPQRRRDSPPQCRTAYVMFIVAPRQFARPMSRESACFLSRGHAVTPSRRRAGQQSYASRTPPYRFRHAPGHWRVAGSYSA